MINVESVARAAELTAVAYLKGQYRQPMNMGVTNLTVAWHVALGDVSQNRSSGQ